MIRNILFDYNGIFGPDADEWEKYKDFVKETGLTNKEIGKLWDLYWPTISTGEQNLIDFLREVAKKSSKDTSAEKLLKEYLDNIVSYKEVLDFATELKKKGYKLIVLSNETKEAQDYKVKKFQLERIFDALYSSADIGMTKSKPAAFKLVLEKEKMNPQETLFIDDRGHNVEMAKSLGMHGIAYKNLEQLKKDIVFSLI